MKLTLSACFCRLVAVATCLGLVLGTDDSQTSLVRHGRKLQQKQLVVRVKLSDKPSSIKLGECQGDCDVDSDCAGDLVCFERTSGEDVPGCTGKQHVNRRADFCVQPIVQSGAIETESGFFNQQNVHNPNPPKSQWVINPKEVEPHTMPIRMTAGPSAKLQLYWEPRAWWQEENFDRRWCLRCRKGCLPGNGLMIVLCDQTPGPSKQVPNLWSFEPSSNSTFLIKVDGENACLSQWDRWTLQIDRCDSNDRAQHWLATAGSFRRGEEFQISPLAHPDWCITQRHHPRYGETVAIEPCATARKSYTAHWNMY